MTNRCLFVYTSHPDTTKQCIWTVRKRVWKPIDVPTSLNRVEIELQGNPPGTLAVAAANNNERESDNPPNKTGLHSVTAPTQHYAMYAYTNWRRIWKPVKALGAATYAFSLRILLTTKRSDFTSAHWEPTAIGWKIEIKLQVHKSPC